MKKEAISKLANIIKLAATLKEVKKMMDSPWLDEVVKQLSKSDVSKLDDKDVKKLLKNFIDLKKNLPTIIDNIKNIQN